MLFFHILEEKIMNQTLLCAYSLYYFSFIKIIINPYKAIYILVYHNFIFWSVKIE
jgi:hypothetical protein